MFTFISFFVRLLCIRFFVHKSAWFSSVSVSSEEMKERRTNENFKDFVPINIWDLTLGPYVFTTPPCNSRSAMWFKRRRCISFTCPLKRVANLLTFYTIKSSPASDGTNEVTRTNILRWRLKAADFDCALIKTAARLADSVSLKGSISPPNPPTRSLVLLVREEG